MANVFAPLRNEPIVDNKGVVTLKFAEYLEGSASGLNGQGTAAFLDVGTDALEVVQLNSSALLPAVDGSLLTNITLDDNSVTNVKLADMAQDTIKGRATASTGDPEDLTATQVRTIINVANASTANPQDPAITDLAITAAASYQQTQAQAVINKVDAILAALRNSGVINT